MATREETIRRIRRALGRPADGSPADVKPTLPAWSPAWIMPTIPAEELLEKFEAELTKVAGVVHRAANGAELDEILGTILTNAGATGVLLSRNPLLAELNLAARLGEGGKWGPVEMASAAEDGSLPLPREATFAATVGITGVEFALAETGSLVVASWTEGAQLASLAPPVHVALYRRSQLVASLDEVLEKLPVARAPEQAWPGRSVVFITGTSRTADIEQILIRGVHGPGEVHAILVAEGCRT